MTFIYDFTPDTPPSPVAFAVDKAYRLHGLAKAGIATTESSASIDMTRGGYTALFETFAEMADQIIDDLERGMQPTARTTAKPAPTSTPVADTFALWQTAMADYTAALATMTEADDQEPPAAIELGEKVEMLGKRLSFAQPRSTADCATLLQWVLLDSKDGTHHPTHKKAQTNAAAYLSRLDTAAA